jgi:hypothetical protein
LLTIKLGLNGLNGWQIFGCISSYTSKFVLMMLCCCIWELLIVLLLTQMRKGLFIKNVSLLLLTAMLFAVVPFHQIFHKHNFSTDSAKTVQLKKTEKPCCKSFEALFGTTVTPQPSATVHQPVSTIYCANYFAYFIKPLLNLANKAPPVNKA